MPKLCSVLYKKMPQWQQSRRETSVTSSLWRRAICRSSSAFFALRCHSSASFLHASQAYSNQADSYILCYEEDEHRNLLYLHTHTHPFNDPFLGLPGWAGTRKVKPIWILLKQETVSGSGISWAICKSAPCSRQITKPAPHHSVFYRDRCPSCRPTNSIKALKANLALSCT